MSEAKKDSKNDSKSDLDNNSMVSLCETRQFESLNNIDADFVCTSREQVTEVHTSWIIENLNTSLYDNGEMIESAAFPTYEQEKDEWSLRIYPKRSVSANNASPQSKLTSIYWLSLLHAELLQPSVNHGWAVPPIESVDEASAWIFDAICVRRI